MSERAYKTGITSAAPGAAYNLGPGASITLYPTAAGSATLKVSTSPMKFCEADVAANNFTTGQAKWVDWATGAVVALAQESTLSAVTAVAVVPTSGTWALEVCQ